MDFSNRIDTQRRTAVYVRISTSMQQSKLDGLVIKLALLKFAEYDLGKEAKSKTFELQQEIDECSKILEDYTSKQTEADLTFNNYAKRVILVAKNDAESIADIMAFYMGDNTIERQNFIRANLRSEEELEDVNI